MFREWKRLSLPTASYAIQPRIWTPDNLARVKDLDTQQRVLWKNREPCLTAMAWTESDLYLVDVRAALTAGALGEFLYRVSLFHADPDYAEHRSRRAHLVALTLDAPPAIAAFARSRRVRVLRFPLHTSESQESNSDAE
jgi:hypothetical protein